jgi:hypothetical protein
MEICGDETKIPKILKGMQPAWLLLDPKVLEYLYQALDSASLTASRWGYWSPRGAGAAGMKSSQIFLKSRAN